MSRRAIALTALSPEIQARFRKKPAKRSAEATRIAIFLKLLTERSLPQPMWEYRFHDTRRWRFDFAWPAWNLALEVDGAIWTRGRHVRGAGWLKDSEKLNCAAAMGWRMLRCQPKDLCTDAFLATIRAALDYHPA